MKLVFLLAFIFGFLSWAIPREAMPATGCAYPAALDSFTNVTTGTILTAADYNKLMCAVESLEDSLRIPNFTVATRPASPEIGRVIYVTDAVDATTCDTGLGLTRNVCVWNGTNWITTGAGGGGGGAPTGASYITSTSDGTLSAEFALGSLATGLLRNTTTTGIPTIAVEGTHYYAPGGTTIPLTGGGTGATTQAGAQAALAVTPGTDVFIQRTFTGHSNVLAIANPNGVTGAPGFTVDNSLIDGSSHFAADLGSSDSYAACPRSISTMSTPAYVDRSVHGFVANTANTGAATIDYCGVGSKALVKIIGGVSTPLATGDILVGQPVLTTYSQAADNFKVISQLASGAGGAGTPVGPTGSCQYNAAGVFGGDAGCIYDATTDVMSLAGGVTAGNTASNSVNTVMGGGISGARTWTLARNADADYAGTTGTLTDGDQTKFNSAGLIVRGGTAQRVAQFMLGAENGAVLVDGDDQPSIFYNHLGQGITINSVWCQSDAGTPSINLQKDDGSPANILSSNLSCATGTGTTTTTFSGTENQIASTNRVNLLMVTAGGVAKRIMVSMRYSLD